MSALSSRSEQFTSSFLEVLQSFLRKRFFYINPETYITLLKKSRSFGFGINVHVAEFKICNPEEADTSAAILDVERMDRFSPENLLAAKQSFSVKK